MKRLASTCKSFLAVCLLSGLCNVVSAQASGDAPLEATAPAGALPQGSLLAVRWRDHRTALTPVYVYLRDALSGTEREIGSNLQSAALAAESSFDWFVPTDVSPGSYAIVLRTFDGSQQASSAAFALTPVVAAPGVIRVLNPPRWAGELPTFAEAERVNVMWDFPTGRPEAVDIVLDVYADHRYAGSKTIAAGVAPLASTGLAQTSLPWAAAIEGCIPATARYRMRMLGERGAVGQSSDFFSISSAHEVDRSACPDSTPQLQPPSPPQAPAPPSPPASGVQPLPNGSSRRGSDFSTGSWKRGSSCRAMPGSPDNRPGYGQRSGCCRCRPVRPSAAPTSMTSSRCSASPIVRT